VASKIKNDVQKKQMLECVARRTFWRTECQVSVYCSLSLGNIFKKWFNQIVCGVLVCVCVCVCIVLVCVCVCVCVCVVLVCVCVCKSTMGDPVLPQSLTMSDTQTRSVCVTQEPLR